MGLVHADQTVCLRAGMGLPESKFDLMYQTFGSRISELGE